MSWQDEHKKHVAGFPAHARSAHAHSSNNWAEIADSTLCGCFYCCEMFAPDDILDWIDEDPEGHGQTAFCPKCGGDSVLGDPFSGGPILGSHKLARAAVGGPPRRHAFLGSLRDSAGTSTDRSALREAQP